MTKNLNYRAYTANFNKKGRWILEGILFLFIFSFFFYRSFIAIPFLIPFLIVYWREKKKTYEKEIKREIAVQFKDVILSVAGSLKAGYAIENGFRQAYNDMIALYGKKAIISIELYQIIVGMDNNITLEKLLIELGVRSGVEDIIDFADIFAAAKRSGGNITEVIQRSASIIADKVEIEKEINVLISAKKMEQRVMNLVPFGIILYISLTSKGFFDILYHNVPGIIIMTICLLVYMAAVLISRRIVDIKV